MKLVPLRHLDTLAAFKDFTKIFGAARADALATAIGKVQRDPDAAPRAVADLRRAGFTRAQAEEVVRQTIIVATGETPPAELLARRATLPHSHHHQQGDQK